MRRRSSFRGNGEVIRCVHFGWINVAGCTPLWTFLARRHPLMMLEADGRRIRDDRVYC
jgi:hypothetical protein